MKMPKRLGAWSMIQLASLLMLGVSTLSLPASARGDDAQKVYRACFPYGNAVDINRLTVDKLKKSLGACYRYKPTNVIQRYAHTGNMAMIYYYLALRYDDCSYARSSANHATSALKINLHHPIRSYDWYFHNYNAIYYSSTCGGFDLPRAIQSFEAMRRTLPAAIKYGASPEQELQIMMDRTLLRLQHLQHQRSLPAYRPGLDPYQQMLRQQEEKEKTIRMFETIYERDRFGRPFP